MPIGPDYLAASVDALVASWPAGMTLHLHSEADTDPLYELPADGGYAPVAAPSWPAASAEGVVTVTVDWGLATGEWPESGAAWVLRDSGGVVVAWDLLADPIEAEAGTYVRAVLDVFFTDATGSV
jgi:hypothetical protein